MNKNPIGYFFKTIPKKNARVYENKLICGIVVTGGGAQLKHISQLLEYVTGMDTRIGYPNEHLAKGNSEEMTSPMFATGVGLVIKGFDALNHKVSSNSGEVISHSKKNKGGFFDKIMNVGQKFFEDNEN